MTTTSVLPTPMTAALRVYTQVLRQKQYTALPHTVLSIQKFLLTDGAQVPVVRQVTWTTFTKRSKLHARHLILLHLLLTWYNKQKQPLAWHSQRKLWSSTDAEAAFYLLRYRLLPQIGLPAFMPALAWRDFNPRSFARYPLEAFLTPTDFPPSMQEYFSVFWEDNYRFGFQIHCHLPATLPYWYSKVFTLRSHHYPVVYDKKSLPLLIKLSLTPLKEVLIFDEITGTHNTARKERLLQIFKALLKLGRQRSLLVEHALYWRITEQLHMPRGHSPGADFFQDKWFAYFYPMLAAD